MHFQVLNLATNRYCGSSDGPYEWQHGESAANFAKLETERTGQKHQPRRIAGDVNWRERERSRFNDGTYIPVPWTSEPWFHENCNPEHFVHLSLDKTAFVAFTEDEEKGAADRQTRMRAGAYLTKFFSNALTTEDITRIATELAVTQESNEVMFATDPDKVEWVYRHGPSSCMSHHLDDYQSDVHPVRVYAGPDLAVAYLERDGRVTARSVVWPEKKLYTRIYGDETRLVPLLKDLGYRHSESLDGARLLKIRCRGGYVCPYVDSAEYVDVGSQYLILRDHRGEYSTEGTSGLIGEEEYYANCERCDTGIEDEDDAYTVYTGRHQLVTWCEGCQEHHSIYCSDEDISVHEEMVVRMSDGSHWSEWKYSREGGVCEATQDRYPLDELETVIIDTDGTLQLWGTSARDDDACRCDITDRWYHSDLIVNLPDGRVVGYDTAEARKYEAQNGEAPVVHTPSPTMPHPDQNELQFVPFMLRPCVISVDMARDFAHAIETTEVIRQIEQRIFGEYPTASQADGPAKTAE
jgi:hypothetical protein